MYIREIPEEDRPRERFLKHGASKLSNKELIEIILGSGSNKISVSDMADDVLKLINNISDLNDLTVNKLMNINGIKEIKAISLLSAVELGKRINSKDHDDYLDKITNPKDIYDKYKDKLANLKQEELWAVFLNSKKRIIGSNTIFRGSLNQSIVHPREIFNSAIKNSASSIIIIHNHPSGDINPSKEDIETTNNLLMCSKIIQIPIIDHIIIGHNNYYSFLENDQI